MFSNYLLSLHWLYLTVSAFSCGQAILYYSNRTDMEATEAHDSRPRGHFLPSGVEVVSPVMPSRLVRPLEQYPSVLITEAKGSNVVTIRWCTSHYCQYMWDKLLWNESTVFFWKRLPTGLFTYQRSSKPNVLQETSAKFFFSFFSGMSERTTPMLRKPWRKPCTTSTAKDLPTTVHLALWLVSLLRSEQRKEMSWRGPRLWS